MKTASILRDVRFVFSLGVLALLATVVTIGRSTRASELPRYKFLVGQELTYRTPDAPKPAEPKPDEAKKNRPRPQIIEEFIVVVVDRNNDGSWRLLFRNNMNYGGNDRWSDGYFDLAADGRVTNLGTLSVMANPLSMFPPLPADGAATWSESISLDETRRDCKAAAMPRAGEVEWSFTEDHHNVFTPIYELSEERDYQFDLEKGVVRTVTRRVKQGWPASRSAESTEYGVALVGTRQLDSSELAPLKADMDKYYAARAEHDKLMEKRTFSHAANDIEKAESPIRALQVQLQTRIFKDILDQQLKQASQYRKYQIEEAERFAKLIDQPSKDWKTTDLDGNPRTLADYRGKVVLLDFWYRGCGWCIRAMPQFKLLVDDFANQPVAILGMNNDKNLDDAKFVIDKMGLNYATLKNGEGDDAINVKYGVQGWPTLVVLDGQGVIRHIHIGYSPNLRQELGDKIRELLAQRQPAK